MPRLSVATKTPKILLKNANPIVFQYTLLRVTLVGYIWLRRSLLSSENSLLTITIGNIPTKLTRTIIIVLVKEASIETLELENICFIISLLSKKVCMSP
ncbi:hypothetical protein ABFE51_00070 [Staphylococcus saprophyticus]